MGLLVSGTTVVSTGQGMKGNFPKGHIWLIGVLPFPTLF